MAEPATVALKHGLRAHYVTHTQIAAQRRAQARRDRKRDDQQPEEPEP
jgi:hypothetical protein